MNITKQEALQKIAELQKFVEELDKPKSIEFEVGDVFAWQTKTGERAVVLATDHKGERFILGGAFNNLAVPFNYHGRTFTSQEMEKHLFDSKYIKIGKLGVVLA
jgi:hypothetical protein